MIHDKELVFSFFEHKLAKTNKSKLKINKKNKLKQNVINNLFKKC